MARLLLILAASLLFAAPAAAAPPELFLRETPWDTHEAVSDWIPLASAPVSSYVGGYEIGYRLQTAGFQRAALTIAAVPHGASVQPNSAPFCTGRNGAAGDIVAAGPELQFEGNGTYTVSVSVLAGDRGDCLTQGETATGSFGVAAMLTPTVVGQLVLRRIETSGVVDRVTAPEPRGGMPGVQCTLGATVVPEAGATAQNLPEDEFPRPGEWACQARVVAQGQDQENRLVNFFGDWSAPTPVLVRADFLRKRSRVVGSRSARRVGFAVTTEFAAEAAGGVATLSLQRVTGCRGTKKYKGPVVSKSRARFSAAGATLKVKRPGKGYYVARLSFGGTKLIRAGQDPNPLYLFAKGGKFGFAPAQRFPYC
ncbi:hypothetical protein [Solirubrobacter soli]|uniref:hypothetical protein n=1 Tax=Solirubrobacter soli TaxID=363832 RepID=UPI000413BA34|nr:hypothetical protein [Solirubrobacter soli]